MVKNVFLGATVWLVLFTAQFSVAQQRKTEVTEAVRPAQKLTEQQKIDHLLLYISNLQGATFIRNGDDFPPEEAAKHLRSKFKKHGSKIKTAHDFIDHLATKSSASGEYYKVRMADGSTVEIYKLLNSELKRVEEQGSTE